MLRWVLNTFPSWVLIAVIAGGTIALGLLAERTVGRRRADDDDQEMLGLTFEFVGIAYAILIGFVIVSLWETQTEARDAVATEASALEDMVLFGHGLPGEESDRLDAAVVAYIEASEDDFAEMKEGRHSETADAAAVDLLDTILSIEPGEDVHAELQATIFDSYKELADLRTHRLAVSRQKLAGELWLLVLASSVAMILLVAAFHGRWNKQATIVISATIGLVLFSLVALSYPFSGDVSVSNAPLGEATEHIR